MMVGAGRLKQLLEEKDLPPRRNFSSDDKSSFFFPFPFERRTGRVCYLLGLRSVLMRWITVATGSLSIWKRSRNIVEQYMLAKCSHPIFLSLHIVKDMSISIVASKTTSWMFKFEQNQRCKLPTFPQRIAIIAALMHHSITSYLTI